MIRIRRHCAESRITHAEDAGLRSLDDANGRFFSIGRSFEREDRLCQRAVDDDFVVNPVIRETMHRSAEQRFLTFERSYRWFVFLRLTGESRNLRMGHSVRHPNLIAPFVIGQGLDLAKLQGDLVRRRAADRAAGRDISVRVQRIHGCRRVAEVGNPEFLILRIHEHTGRIQ